MTNATHLLEVFLENEFDDEATIVRPRYLMYDYYQIVPFPGYTIAQLAALIIDTMPEEQAAESAFRIVPIPLSPEMQRLHDTM
jgi:hypothetical protein